VGSISRSGQSLFGADFDVILVAAWIPDTLRSFLAHEVGNDDLLYTFPLTFNAGHWRKRQGKSVIPDLVSERSERRVSGIHASTERSPEAARNDNFPSHGKGV
jgi:hypothetical protein